METIELKKIGNQAYSRWWQTNGLSDRDKLGWLMLQLGATIDQFGMLQLKGPGMLDPHVPPHSEFYARLRQSVQSVYSTPLGLNRDELGQKLHLFRSYIDKQNIEHIRQFYSGATDYEKLLNYAKNQRITLDYSVDATYHNRTSHPFDYPRNMKIVLPKYNTLQPGVFNARMGEFIIEIATGRFVSQWNLLQQNTDGTYDTNPDHYDLAECGDIANTESFNYGICHGRNIDRWYFDSYHYWLDVNHPADYLLRRKVCRLWRPAVDFDRGGRYADVVKKERDVAIWRQIPLTQRVAVYERFLARCQRKKRNRGIGSRWSG